ncbi:serine/threonine-protein kinase [Catenulispora pinisilvae]|uniref:serine/threonine-protein kinase n=1 Tax=Catenulispora pinisilvae TaxID=2705253 RepID=UPI001891048D|nr:serine/threonine-protein kinase [Catenulispora pinisilvae]
MAFDETRPGQMVGGRYLLVAEIGHGGMGRVWEARDTQLDRLVALKEVLLPALPPAQQEIRLKQAEREGKNAAALADHPNIVSVYDVITDAGSPWIVMQLVKGRSLRSVLRDPSNVGVPDDQDVELTPLSQAQGRQIAEAIFSALDTMHTAGIVHRDIKPHNILLADDGGVLLTDFGIAKSETDATVTVSGSVMGTMAYIAPERAEGEPGSPASDFFSLGVTLFEAVEGYSPFERKNSKTGTLTAILTKPLPPMAKAGTLAPLIEALTLKLPDQRPNHEQALALLNGNGTGGWTKPARGEAAAEAGTADLPSGRLANQGMAPKMPWDSVTLTGSAGLPRPRLIDAPQPSGALPPTGNKRTREWLVAGLVVLLLAIAGLIVYEHHQDQPLQAGNLPSPPTGSAPASTAASSGWPAGCADALAATDVSHHRSVRVPLDLIPFYQQQATGLSNAASEATDPAVKSALQTRVDELNNLAGAQERAGNNTIIAWGSKVTDSSTDGVDPDVVAALVDNAQLGVDTESDLAFFKPCGI